MTKRRVEVTWDDASTSRHSPGLIVRRSIGWLVKKTRRKVVLAQTNDRHSPFEDFLTIPRPNVRRIRRLK